MARTRKSPGSAKYYDALRKVFKLQSGILTAALPHAGERGSNDEERCRAFLTSVLPRRYSIGSGFIVSSARGAKPSPQQDVIIHDDFLNSPLHRELSAGVFPIEMVYATVEVKGYLQSRDLQSSLASIGRVRRLAHECWYEFPEQNIMPGRPRLVRPKKPIKRPPRAFIFAFDTIYKSPSALKRALERELNKGHGAHLHGIIVLSRNWFAFQRPFRLKAAVKVFANNALLRFVNNMLTSLKSVVVREAEMGRYLNIPTVSEIEAAPSANPKKNGKAKEAT